MIKCCRCLTCCGRAVPLLWRVFEHLSATISAHRYLPMLRLAHRRLQSYPNVMLLADRGFANHDLLRRLSQSRWHYCLRLPSDVVVHDPHRHPIEVGYLWPPKGGARCHDGIGLRSDGRWRCNLVLANVKGVKELWVVITDEPPSLNTLWQYALRFQVEERFLNSKSGVFELQASGIRSAQALERRYLVPAVATLYTTTEGIAHGVVSSTAPELAKTIDALFREKLLDRSLVEHMSYPIHNLRKYPLFENLGYGLGLFVDTGSPYGKVTGHIGEGPGYSVSAFHFPSLAGSSTTIAALVNQDKHDYGLALVYKMAHIIAEH